MNVNYWYLKNKDLGMQKFARERTKLILNGFVKMVEKYCEGSYENVYATDQPLYYKSDQRLDFMMNVYQEIIKYANSKLTELEDETNRRL